MRAILAALVLAGSVSAATADIQVKYNFSGGLGPETPKPAAARTTTDVPSLVAPRQAVAAVARPPEPPTPSQVGGQSRYTGMSVVPYGRSVKPGTIVISTSERSLYYVLPGGMAERYGIGVGREGFTWKGTKRVTGKAEWPGWTPPQRMIEREKAKGVILPSYMPGGPNNPLGARAMYLGGSLFRIHGTNQPQSIGQAVSSGCIRMLNEEVIALYDKVPVGTVVIVE